jgi:hypothetical protein
VYQKKFGTTHAIPAWLLFANAAYYKFAKKNETDYFCFASSRKLARVTALNYDYALDYLRVYSSE